MSSGLSLSERVSPVSAEVSLAMAQMSPATQWATVRCCLPSGEVRAPTRSSASWSAWPRSAMPCPDTWTTTSGRMVPEKTRTMLMRPTYGSDMVLMTSPSSGPFGSQRSPFTGLPSTVVTTGIGCSMGEGKACVMTSSSSANPTPCGAEAARTG